MLDLRNCDNMELMKQFPDKYFELAIVDPPYGIDVDNRTDHGKKRSLKSASKSKEYDNKGWDKTIPTDDYFNELFRVSKNQIIWGANYFGLSGGMLYWHKNVTMPTYSTGEIAWLSWLQKIDFVNITWHGMLQQDMKNKERRIHPTQKPVALYRWLLQNYAKKGDKILDTHLGSMSIAIACEMEGFDLTGCELDPEYYRDGMKRLETFKKQITLF